MTTHGTTATMAPTQWALAAATIAALAMSTLLATLAQSSAPFDMLRFMFAPWSLAARIGPLVAALLLRKSSAIATILAAAAAAVAQSAFGSAAFHAPGILAIATLVGVSLTANSPRAASADVRRARGETVHLGWRTATVGILLSVMPAAMIAVAVATRSRSVYGAALLADFVVAPAGHAILSGWVCAWVADRGIAKLERRPAAVARRAQLAEDDAPTTAAAAAAGRDGDADMVKRYAIDEDRMDDLAATSAVKERLATPRDGRDQEWAEALLTALWNASLELPDRPVFNGPDFFPYLRMNLPRAGEAFQANCLARQAERLAGIPCGTALFDDPDATDPAYVISAGTISAMLLYDDHRGDPADLADLARAAAEGGRDEDVMRQGSQMMIGSPSKEFLTPGQARGLHHHLKEGWGLDEPRIALIVSPEARPQSNLVIQLSRAEMPEDDRITRDRMRMLTWYLPPSRSLVLRPISLKVDDMARLIDYF